MSTLNKLLRGEPETVIRLAPWLMLSSITWIMLSKFLPIFGLSCFFLIVFGTAGAMLTEFRTERGLWMLAALFLLIYSTAYAMFIVGEIQDWMRNARPDFAGAVDTFIGTSLLVANNRFLYRVMLFNWSLD